MIDQSIAEPLRRHVLVQGTHFILRNGKLQVKQTKSYPTPQANYRVIPYNQLNKPAPSDYDKQTIKRLVEEIQELKNERRELFNVIDEQRRKNKVMFDKMTDLDQQSRILKEMDSECGDKTKRYLYRQFMYSQAEVRKIRLQYEKKIRKLQKQHEQQVIALKLELSQQQQIVKSQFQILQKGQIKRSKSKKKTSNTQEDEQENDDQILMLKPLCLNLNLQSIKKGNVKDTSFDLDLSQGRSNQSTARKLLSNLNENEGKVSSFFIKQNKSQTERNSMIKTARASVTQKIWK